MGIDSGQKVGPDFVLKLLVDSVPPQGHHSDFDGKGLGKGQVPWEVLRLVKLRGLLRVENLHYFG